MKHCNLLFQFILALIFFDLLSTLRVPQGKHVNVEKDDLRSKGIFGSLKSILEYLQLPQYRSLPAIKEMIKKYRKSLHIGKQLTDFLPGPRRRFIVIEGLYTSKRHAVAKLVARSLRGKHILNPFRKLAGVNTLPATYDTRRAYYSLTKYGIANLVPKLLALQPVVMERYWLDQAAFVIAKTFGENLPELDSGLYDWPSDLIKPDITFFINADNKSTEHSNLPNEISNFTLNILRVYDEYKKVMKIIEISSNQKLWHIVKEVLAQVRLLGPDVVTEIKRAEPIRLMD
ncbi:UMP kinase activity protein [Homalodisca vitripennis]|nr:UMP kinase activity protein [Homalodisca vitripennis]